MNKRPNCLIKDKLTGDWWDGGTALKSIVTFQAGADGGPGRTGQGPGFPALLCVPARGGVTDTTGSEKIKVWPGVDSRARQLLRLTWERCCRDAVTRTRRRQGPRILKSICKTMEGCHFEKVFHQWKSY